MRAWDFHGTISTPSNNLKLLWLPSMTAFEITYGKQLLHNYTWSQSLNMEHFNKKLTILSSTYNR